MLQVLNARILADEREREIRRHLRERAVQREAEVALADASAGLIAAESRRASPDRLCPDCPCRVATAPAR
jgi:hypothetical protein